MQNLPKIKLIFCNLLAALIIISAAKPTLAATERTLSIIKPEVVARNEIGAVINELEKNSLKIVNFKKIQLTPEMAGRFYYVHQNKPFYEDVKAYMSSGPIIAIVLEGEDAIVKYRALMGPTDISKAEPHTLRAKFGTSKQQNAVHGSDSPESAKEEIAFFFAQQDL